MAEYHITLTDKQQASLRAIAEYTGKSGDAVIHEAVNQLILHYRRAWMQQARGMWRDRTDLPDFATIRREFDRPREGWDEQFKTMAANGDDRLPGWADHLLTTWDQDEWEW